uniref:Spliceosome-associated protein CWC27 homolog n=1 Tax=Ciona savignyi TaxID=51511 RepID=H2YFG9_CIOSA
MSNIYIKEPSTDGKVLLRTSLGDIDVELWSKEAPIACRNFVQLCMEGYYNNVVFHRIVPGFIVQGGDPTGTGEGGESVFGKPFKDEFHTRLRFVRRGLVAMANAGPNDNGSQFFFTLGPCNDLNKKHTIFGKVAGDTIYNLVRLGEVQTTDDERPVNPPCIKWTKVLSNPFDDIQPRTEPGKDKNEVKKEKKKNFKLLSFGEEAEEEEIDVAEFAAKHATKSKSSHDLANDPKLSSLPAIPNYDAKNEKLKTGSDVPDKVCCNLKIIFCKTQKNKKMTENKEIKTEEVSSDEEVKQQRLESVKSKLSKLKRDKEAKLRKESRKIAREILKSRRGANDKKEEDKEEAKSSDEEDATSNPMYADYKMQMKKYKAKTVKYKDKGTTREQETLSLLNSFKSKLENVRKEAGWDDEHMEEPPDDGEDDDSGWWVPFSLMLHRLTHEETDKKRDAKDVNREITEDSYDIHDPRNPINKRRR